MNSIKFAFVSIQVQDWAKDPKLTTDNSEDVHQHNNKKMTDSP